jgi:thiamine pyrophosphate-dependent acetolactate synthase large subunit-like protein
MGSLRDDAIVVGDSGTVATWWAREIPARRGQLFTLSGTLASMANGIPHANAAQLAFPDRQVVAFVGDGGFSMLMAEFATAVKYHLPIKVVVARNNTLGMIKWEQMGSFSAIRVRLRAAAYRLCEGRRGVRRPGIPCRRSRDVRSRVGSGHSARLGRCSSKLLWIHSRPHFRPESRSSKRPSSPKHWPAASRTARNSR